MKKALIVIAVLALVAGLVVVGQAGSAYKVTGGGQFQVATTGGPGDTIAFNAQQLGDPNDPDAAKGQVQYVDRTNGKVVGIFHGEVECLRVVATGDNGAARLAGVWDDPRTAPATDGTFEILADDNGEPNQNADKIFIDRMDPPDCVDDSTNNPDSPTGLARGNIQIHE